MKNQPWLDACRNELTRRGLPKRHVGRLMEELADHAHDLMEEMEMNSQQSDVASVAGRLGEPSELADAAVSNYRTTRFVGRHPWLTFLVAPWPMMLLAWAACFAAGLLLFNGLQHLLGDTYQIQGKPADQWPPALLTLAWTLHYLARIVPSALVAAAFCYLVRRSGRSVRWALLACGLVAVLSSALCTSFHFPEADGGVGRYTIGLGLALEPRLPEWIYILQFSVPMGIGLVFALVYRPQQPVQTT